MNQETKQVVKGYMKEKTKRTSKKWCSCGYKNRKDDQGCHSEGTHHSQGKKVSEKVLGVKTNVGDPLNNRMGKK